MYTHTNTITNTHSKLLCQFIRIEMDIVLNLEIKIDNLKVYRLKYNKHESLKIGMGILKVHELKSNRLKNFEIKTTPRIKGLCIQARNGI